MINQSITNNTKQYKKNIKNCLISLLIFGILELLTFNNRK